MSEAFLVESIKRGKKEKETSKVVGASDTLLRPPGVTAGRPGVHVAVVAALLARVVLHVGPRALVALDGPWGAVRTFLGADHNSCLVEETSYRER